MVTLNFDSLGVSAEKAKWAPPKATERFRKKSRLRKEDWPLLYARRFITANEPQSPGVVWHAHGCIDQPQTIRLGLRDYGLMPQIYEHAFRTFKAWERKQLRRRVGDEGPLKAQDHSWMLGQLQKLDRGELNDADSVQADHWVIRFMLLPVRVIGASMSKEETGLRWLMVQRERNLARVTHSVPIEHYSRTDSLPVGVLRREFATWHIAWATALSHQT